MEPPSFAPEPRLPMYSEPQRSPPVLLWCRLYCGLMTLALLPFPVVCLAAALFPQWLADAEHSVAETRLMGAVMFVPFAIPTLAFLASFFLPRRPWVWVYYLVLICLGMTGCLLPACIALLLYWLKPEVKVYFGRT